MSNFDELIYSRLTEQQREFVDDFDHSILVSASAGTGKTTTMIRKILHLILIEKVDISDLLIVTYTTAAASKMKHDLYMCLQRAIEMCDDENMQEHISRQIDLLNNADIGTIHAFCNKIIKKYFFELGVDPNYSILSNEKSKNYLMNNALSAVFEWSVVNEGEKFGALYENFNNARNDEALRSAILTLYEYLICRHSYQSWCEDKLDSCYTLEESNIVWQFLLNYYNKQFQNLRPEFQSLYNLAYDLPKIQSFCVARTDIIDKINSVSCVKDVAKILRAEKLPNKPSINLQKYPELVELSERMDSLSEAFKKLKNDAMQIFGVFLEADFVDNNAYNQELAKDVYALCLKLIEEYGRIKKENNLLDFNDLEMYANRLTENDKIVEALRQDYKYIFVDEYQDVNNMQSSLIDKIAQSNNLYMIGDVKQSIYRFRQSSPEIFLDKYNKYKNGDVDKKLILFNKNFRSDVDILGVVNNVFDNAITVDNVGINYKEEARLIAGKEGSVEQNVYLSIIDMADIKSANDEQVYDNEISKREYEAQLIVNKVAQIIKTGRYQYKDIAILLRDKKELTQSTWVALKKYNIPVSVTIKCNIFDSAEVQILYSLLSCVYNEANDIAFVALLRSPIIRMTDDELANIRLCAPDAQTFYEACLKAEESLPNESCKIAKLRQVLRDFRLDIISQDIYTVLKKFIDDNMLITYFKSMPDGVEKECYINEFCSIVASAVYQNDLARLLDYLDIIKDKDSEVTITGGADSVTLMTMHSSKGLDYPVVIVGGLGEKILKNAKGNIRINKDLGFAVNGVDEDFARINNINMNAIALKNRKEEFEEAIRLMYVALTRPKELLYITGVVDLTGYAKRDLDSCQTYFDVLAMSFSGAELSNFVNKKSKFEIFDEERNMCVEIVDARAFNLNASSQQIILDVSNPNLVKSLKKYHNLQLPDYSNISFKNSVSSILKEQEVDYTNALDNFKKMNVTESMNSNDAMELGTEYHKIMQNIDFGNDSQDIKALVDQLVFEHVINPIWLGKIDINKIAKAKKIVAQLIGKGDLISKEPNFLLLAPHNELIDESVCNKNVLVQGILDLVIESKDGVIIVDYKTNRTHDESQLIDTYRTQLSLYSKAYELAYGKRVVAKYLYSFAMDKLIEVK